MNRTDIIQRTLHTAGTLHVREAGEGEAPSRVVEGYAIIFNEASVPLYMDEEYEIREVIAPEAVTREFLDGSDIKLTMFHSRQLILGRSKNGEGTLSYEIDDKGVKFSCEMPNTVDGDKALELVKRGDLAGCSFAFSTRYYDNTCVTHECKKVDKRSIEIYTVRVMTGIYDFTIAADPAYEATSVEAREFVSSLRPEKLEVEETKDNNYREQVAAMRAMARKIFQ